MDIRLQKRIAESGYCSRRKAESLMEAGKVKVNGVVVTKLGSKVNETDKIQVNSKILKFSTEKRTIALHKPEGTITSKSDPHHNKTIMDLLPDDMRSLKPAGRLDKDSEGLIILSEDGELIQKLTHPKHGHRKTYEIIVKGRVQDHNLEPLRKGGMKLEGYALQPMEATIIRSTKDRKTWVELVLWEGRKRQIRRIMDKIGFPVVYLRRIGIGKLNLDDLEKGEFKILSEKEIQLALS